MKLNKPPRDKPPLLGDASIRRFVSQTMRSNWIAEDFRVIAQAQRELDIKHYEGGI